MSEQPGHTHGTASGKKLWLSLGVTLLFCAGEALAGFVSHSLALLSDAGHNLSDALALGLAAYAASAMRKPAAGTHTYGYYRVSTLTALFNSSTLIAIALFIAIEALGRFRHPEPIEGTLMIWVALVSVVMNTGIALALSRDAKESLNSKAAFVHMAGDALSSLAVVAAGVIVHFTGWPYADPVVSLLIGAFILWSAYDILRESTSILMEKVPRGLDVNVLAERIKSVQPVCAIHDLHVWTLGENRDVLTCHVVLPAGCSLSESEQATAAISKMLGEEFSIEHATIQTEQQGSSQMGQGAALYCKLEPPQDEDHQQ